MNSNTTKNRDYDAKQTAKVRPTQAVYNFAELERVVNNWVLATRLGGEQFSPFETVNS